MLNKKTIQRDGKNSKYKIDNIFTYLVLNKIKLIWRIAKSFIKSL
jgi:hypothetical protein